MTDTKQISLLNCKTRPLTEKESNTMIRVCLTVKAPDSKMPPIFDEAMAIQIGPIGQILFNHCKAQQVTLQGGLGLLLCTFSGVPGHIVLWAMSMKLLADKLGKSEVTLDDWAYAFPMGVPTDEEYNRVWDALK